MTATSEQALSRRVRTRSCVWAVVPMKRLANAKSRLRFEFSPCARARLALLMLEDVLDALTMAARLDGVCVVTDDKDVGACARAHGAVVLQDPPGGGHNEAIEFGLSQLPTDVDAALIVSADVPLATAEEVDHLLALAGDRAVALVPASSDRGTNALFLRPPGAMRPRFGEGSFERHLDAARVAGLDPLVAALPGLGLDLDRCDDLAEALGRRRMRRTRSGAYLASLGWAVDDDYREGSTL